MTAQLRAYGKLLTRLDVGTWGEDANCIGKATTLEDPALLGQARQLCQGCPVKTACGEDLITRHTDRSDPGGYRAGMTEEQRRKTRQLWYRTNHPAGGPAEKRCGKCKESLPITEFYARQRNKTDGRTNVCKTCERKRKALAKSLARGREVAA